jgi:hypothetical protein
MLRFILSYFEFYSGVVKNGYVFTRIIFLHTMFHKYRGTYASFVNFLFFLHLLKLQLTKDFLVFLIQNNI